MHWRFKNRAQHFFFKTTTKQRPSTKRWNKIVSEWKILTFSLSFVHLERALDFQVYLHGCKRTGMYNADVECRYVLFQLSWIHATQR